MLIAVPIGKSALSLSKILLANGSTAQRARVKTDISESGLVLNPDTTSRKGVLTTPLLVLEDFEVLDFEGQIDLLHNCK